MNRPDWIIKNDGYFTFKSEWWCSCVSYGYQKGIPRVLRKLFFQSWQMHLDFFFSKHSFLTFFQKLQKVLVWGKKTLWDASWRNYAETTSLEKKKWKVFFPVEKAKKVTQNEKQSQSQHLVNLFSLSQHLVAFASRKWKKKKGCKMQYRIFPPYFRLWGSQNLCSFFRIHLREGCKNGRKICPQILCAFTYTFLCVDVCGLFNNIYI